MARDEPGQRLAAGLAAAGVDVAGLVVDADRPTTTKTRIMARQQQLLRLDHEDRRRVNSAVVTEVLRAIDRRLPQVDAVMVADYDKGLVFGPVLRGLLEHAAVLGTPVVVDPKDSSVAGYRGATLLKPNLEEAGRLVGKTLADADVDAAGRQLLDKGQVAAVLITRGAGGMTLFERGLAPLHLAAEAREVRDVTGAGDTVTATLAVALAAGASLEQATRLASCAAGIVVGKTGTAVVTHTELAGGHSRQEKSGGRKRNDGPRRCCTEWGQAAEHRPGEEPVHVGRLSESALGRVARPEGLRAAAACGGPCVCEVAQGNSVCRHRWIAETESVAPRSTQR